MLSLSSPHPHCTSPGLAEGDGGPPRGATGNQPLQSIIRLSLIDRSVHSPRACPSSPHSCLLHPVPMLDSTAGEQPQGVPVPSRDRHSHGPTPPRALPPPLPPMRTGEWVSTFTVKQMYMIDGESLSQRDCCWCVRRRMCVSRSSSPTNS